MRAPQTPVLYRGQRHNTKRYIYVSTFFLHKCVSQVFIAETEDMSIPNPQFQKHVFPIYKIMFWILS